METFLNRLYGKVIDYLNADQATKDAARIKRIKKAELLSLMSSNHWYVLRLGFDVFVVSKIVRGGDIWLEVHKATVLEGKEI